MMPQISVDGSVANEEVFEGGALNAKGRVGTKYESSLWKIDPSNKVWNRRLHGEDGIVNQKELHGIEKDDHMKMHRVLQRTALEGVVGGIEGGRLIRQGVTK